MAQSHAGVSARAGSAGACKRPHERKVACEGPAFVVAVQASVWRVDGGLGSN